MAVTSTPHQLETIIAKNLALEASLIEAGLSLEAEGIDFIVLKGIPLARRLHQQISQRVIVDNDLLVRRSNVKRARQVLGRLGYEPPAFKDLHAHLKVDFQFPMYRRDQYGTRNVVDLHWNAFHPALYPVDESLLWSRSERNDGIGKPLRVFDKPMTLLHLSSHFAQHQFLERYILDDFAAAWNRWGQAIDVADLLGLSRSTGLTHALDFAFRSAERLEMLSYTRPAIASYRSSALERLIVPSQLFKLADRKAYGRRFLPLVLAGPRGTLRFIRSELFPPIENLSAIYGRPVSRALYLRYLERPLRPVGRMLSRRLRHLLGKKT